MLWHGSALSGTSLPPAGFGFCWLTAAGSCLLSTLGPLGRDSVGLGWRISLRISSSWSLLISSSCRTRAGLKLCNFYSVVSMVQKIALQVKLHGMQFLKQGLEKKCRFVFHRFVRWTSFQGRLYFCLALVCL